MGDQPCCPGHKTGGIGPLPKKCHSGRLSNQASAPTALAVQLRSEQQPSAKAALQGESLETRMPSRRSCRSCDSRDCSNRRRSFVQRTRSSFERKSKSKSTVCAEDGPFTAFRQIADELSDTRHLHVNM